MVIKWSYWFSTTISPKSLISQWFTLSLCSIVICRLKYRLSQIAKNLQLSVKIQIEARLQAVETYTFYTQYPFGKITFFFFISCMWEMIQYWRGKSYWTKTAVSILIPNLLPCMDLCMCIFVRRYVCKSLCWQ